MIKNLPANLGDVVQSLGQEDPLEEVMATHSRILACRIPWTEEPGGLYSPWGLKELDTTERQTHFKSRQESSTLQDSLSSVSLLFLSQLWAVCAGASFSPPLPQLHAAGQDGCQQF